MNSMPVLLLLLFDGVLLATASRRPAGGGRREDSLFISLLFFCSGMPALIYQIVWQRSLFAIYGVNAQSVAVVVTAFMLGLGIGSLVGGRLSRRYPRHGVLIFGIAELGVAVFGLCSLRLFHWVAGFTAGAGLAQVVVFSLFLLLLPTILMGATLPLLVENLVLHTHKVGAAVSRLYFVNTFGSAVACYLCASFLLRSFSQSGAVAFAACMNTAVGATAYLYARGTERAEETAEESHVDVQTATLPLWIAMVLAATSGFIALGFELTWFRVFSIASADRAPAFALLLSTYLAGIAAGSFLSERTTKGMAPERLLQVVAALFVLAGTIAVYLPPLVGDFMSRNVPYLYSAPFFFLTAALIGSVLPLLCQLSVRADNAAGRGVSLIYVANIVGSAAGSLGIGFELMNYWGLRQISLGLSSLALCVGALLFVIVRGRMVLPPAWATALLLACAIAVPVAGGRYSLLFERLTFGDREEARSPFARVVENRNGIIDVTKDDAVFSQGVYDGYFNVNPMKDVNLVVRAYALSAFCPNPKRVLVIGLASASWAQIFANHPQVETLDAVEINPGYLHLIPEYPMVKSFPENSKVHIYVDDGRRWLVAHPEARYDAIIANATFNWRDHATGLLSVEYLRLVREHLNPGGVYYFNTTESPETIATALSVFPHGLRVLNFVAVSDAPIRVDKEHWLDVLQRYKLDGKPVFEPGNAAGQTVLAAYRALADTVYQMPPRELGLEAEESLRARLQHRRIITDDNMGQEWIADIPMNWRQPEAASARH